MSELAELKAEIAALRKEIEGLRAERVVHHHYHAAPAPYTLQPPLDPRYYPYQPNWAWPYCGIGIGGQAVGIAPTAAQQAQYDGVMTYAGNQLGGSS